MIPGLKISSMASIIGCNPLLDTTSGLVRSLEVEIAVTSSETKLLRPACLASLASS